MLNIFIKQLANFLRGRPNCDCTKEHGRAKEHLKDSFLSCSGTSKCPGLRGQCNANVTDYLSGSSWVWSLVPKCLRNFFCFINCDFVSYISLKPNRLWVAGGMWDEGSGELVPISIYIPAALNCISLILSIGFLENYHHSSLCIPATDHYANCQKQRQMDFFLIIMFHLWVFLVGQEVEIFR